MVTFIEYAGGCNTVKSVDTICNTRSVRRIACDLSREENKRGCHIRTICSWRQPLDLFNK